MFNREELLTILQNVNDEVIKEKVEAMLFVNKPLVDKVIEDFKDKGLMKIEKSNDTNEYYIHLEEDKYDVFNAIAELTDIAFKFRTNHTYAELSPIEHERVDKMWWHRDMIQVWTREDVKEHWRDK